MIFDVCFNEIPLRAVPVCEAYISHLSAYQSIGPDGDGHPLCTPLRHWLVMIHGLVPKGALYL